MRKKNKRKKTRKKKKFRSLKAVEKLVLPNPFLLINNKAPKVLDAQVEYHIYSNKRLTSNYRPPRKSAHPKGSKVIASTPPQSLLHKLK